MKKLTNLKGVKALSKNVQKSINGGGHSDRCGFIAIGQPWVNCPPGAICLGGICRYVLL